MNLNSSLPWGKMIDFLGEVGTARNEVEFIQLIVGRIETLVPFDLYCVFGVIDSEGRLCGSKSFVATTKWFNYFKDHYWRVFPDISKENGVNTKLVDWIRYLDTEYAADFMQPQHIRYSLGVTLLGAGYIGTLALNRSKTSPPFNGIEQQIMELLQPNLSNLYRMFNQLEPKEPLIPEPSESACRQPGLKQLTQRENEIAGLLCRGFSTREICTKLFISENTTYRHINNIFAKLNLSSRTELVAKLMGGYIQTAEN